uniref:Uncharacterized protein LOC114342427 n=1 Tax=Diabrotica virgifera virgifera TaxID=50390 RepID=A0A6P7GUH2_DIAVI
MDQFFLSNSDVRLRLSFKSNNRGNAVILVFFMKVVCLFNNILLFYNRKKYIMTGRGKVLVELCRNKSMCEDYENNELFLINNNVPTEVQLNHKTNESTAVDNNSSSIIIITENDNMSSHPSDVNYENVDELYSEEVYHEDFSDHDPVKDPDYVPDMSDVKQEETEQVEMVPNIVNEIQLPVLQTDLNDINVEVQQNGRKRKRNVDLWKTSIRKVKKEAGKEYSDAVKPKRHKRQ